MKRRMMMKPLLKYSLMLCTAIFLSSCGSSKPKVVTTKKEVRTKKTRHYNPEVTKRNNTIKPKDERVYDIVNYAIGFEGTKYKYGGTTKRGMDCSGLLYVSFQENDIQLPRTSRAMSLQGERLYLKDVTVGDLLFFETNKNKKVINHVGMVVDISQGDILFIHSTTSLGVVISKLSENYWNNTFVMARRVI
ncbi:C40 family peptidase [Zunongwangia endophytica]|uniref:C40 family peptidase n=1 Tax=Zunongwangia endophytica TaxID=1808945 RepID=A0ABV8H8U3_9FLAO|nr:C40 family peptidase [Zunongwangia endophytica]MDN3596334.1 C40 family peptidase [Zunongwangia endophytica]